jgi:probable AcnD-accessory protein PrpF
MSQLRIPAVYMRGGSSKGLFFLARDLPVQAAARDAILLRAIGSPDPFGTQMDGMGGATSSTSKVVVIAPSTREGHDVDYLFGAVPISALPVDRAGVDRAGVDWSGNCGNLSAAVGPFAIARGLVAAPREGMATVRIWQANIGATIVARVPMRDGEVLEEGDFVLDGVAFPGAEIVLEFLDPAGSEEGGGEAAMFPTGHRIDRLVIPGLGTLEATLINAGMATAFVRATDLGLEGCELPTALNARRDFLERCEAIRARAAVAMGLAASPEEVTRLRPHSPKLAFVAESAAYISTSGKRVEREEVDLVARIVSMGKVHHAMTGTGAVALAVAAAVPGTIPSGLARRHPGGTLRFGHPAGTMRVGAEVEKADGTWVARKAVMSRSARRLMEGFVLVPPPAAKG